MMQYLSTDKSCIHNYHIYTAGQGKEHIFSLGMHLQMLNETTLKFIKNTEQLMHFVIRWLFGNISEQIGVKS